MRAVAFSLNLAALTDEELHLLLGDEGALALLPGISRARLEGRPEPGPTLPGNLHVRELPGRLWGGTPEQSRLLARLDEGLRASGATPQNGAVWLEEASGDFIKPYWAPETAATLRWNEAGTGVTLETLSWLRDQASGFRAVLSTTRGRPSVPAPSDEVDIHHHPESAPGELLTLHASYVLRHGRALKLAPEAEWQRPWRDLHRLNVAAWERRGLLLPSTV